MSLKYQRLYHQRLSDVRTRCFFRKDFNVSSLYVSHNSQGALVKKSESVVSAASSLYSLHFR